MTSAFCAVSCIVTIDPKLADIKLREPEVRLIQCSGVGEKSVVCDLKDIYIFL